MKNNSIKKGDRVFHTRNSMSLPVNARATVETVSSGGYVKLVGLEPWFPVTDFQKVDKETIVITTDGDIGTAKLLKNGETIKVVKLIRYKNDKHDMKALAAYAVQKLIPDDGNMLINVKAGYTGSVCVVNSTNPNYKNGKIFEFAGGECINSHYPFAGHKFNDLSAINKFCKGYHINFNVLELHRR